MNNYITPLALAVATASLISSPAFSSDDNQIAFEEGLRIDGAEIARMQGIEEEDAIQRLRWQVASGDIVEQLREQHADRLAGLYTEHSPTDRIVVRLTGDDDGESSQTISAGDQTIQVDFEYGADHTHAELRNVISEHRAAWIERFPTLQGTYTDARNGEIVLNVVVSSDETAEIEGQAASIADELSVPIRVHAIPAPLERQAVRGSGALGVGCTSGFVVNHSGTSSTGVLTAAHCEGGNTSYLGVDGSTASLTLQASSNTPIEDQQWYTSDSTNEPQFYADSTTTPRTLTGRRTQASTSVGNNMCHYGTTTGYTAGMWLRRTMSPRAICVDLLRVPYRVPIPG